MNKFNKKGFVFMESIIALVLFTLFLVTILSSYSALTRKVNSKKYYNQVSDRYILYNISMLPNYLDKKDVSFTKELSIDNSYKKLTCGEDPLNKIFSNESNCKNFLAANEIENLYVMNYKGFNDEVSKNYSIENGALEFIKTLSKGQIYLVGVFKRNEKYYYAELEISE